MKKIYALLLAAALPALGQAQILKIYSRLTPTNVIETTRVDSITTEQEQDAVTKTYSTVGTIHGRTAEGTAVDEKYNFSAADSLRFLNVNELTTVWKTLEATGKYTYFMRLVDDYDVLHPTAGGRTLRERLSGWNDCEVYAANDAAWEAFFAENAKRPTTDPWHNATSYERLSAAQKSLLAGSAVLPSYGGDQARSMAQTEFVRLQSEAGNTDSVAVVKENDMPRTYSQSEKDYWARFRTANGGRGQVVLGEYEAPMTAVISAGWRERMGVTDADMAIIMGGKTATAYANDAAVQAETQTDNGALNATSRPVVPTANMAEVIRTNGRTDIFSHILDRFSAPFYDEALTQAVRSKMAAEGREFKDSVFVKRYFSDSSYGHEQLRQEPTADGTLQDYNPYTGDSYYTIPSLKFDPAWNGLYYLTRPESDMAAIFVPNDEAMWRYFTEGGGKALIGGFGTAAETYATTADLLRAIDQIPVGTLQTLVNHVMLRSFSLSVPSKMTRLRDDALQQMFYPEDVDKIDTCMLASNGAVYVMSDVYAPQDFTGIAAPAFAGTDSKIMKFAIYDGNYDNYLNLHFYTALQAPQAHLTFFLPTDAALANYYDPISFKSRTSRAIQFGFKSASFPITTKCLNYTYSTGAVGRVILGQGSSLKQEEVANYLKDILLNHTILNDGRQDIRSRNEYYETLGGPIVKVVRDAQGKICQVLGGLQLENQRNGLTNVNPGVTECNVVTPYESLKNGETYALDAPAIPTYRSLWSVLSGEGLPETENPYASFFALCDVREECLTACGLIDASLTASQKQTLLRKYVIFQEDNGLDQNATFLRGNFTAFIPSNSAVKAAIEQGLPTWSDIESECSHLATFEDSMRVQMKIMQLTNFVRGHFVYGQAVADQETFDKDYTQVTIDPMTGVAPKLNVRGLGGGEMTVTDANGRTCRVTPQKNTLVRDVTCSKAVSNQAMGSSLGTTLVRAQCGVVHQIDGVLNF